jgi:hypothetical protein
VVVVARAVVVVGVLVVVVVAAVVVVGTLVVDDEDTAVGSVVVSPLDLGDPLHPERTTRTMNTSQRTRRMRHLPMLIFPHSHCLPNIKRSQVNTTPPLTRPYRHICAPGLIVAYRQKRLNSVRGA